MRLRSSLLVFSLILCASAVTFAQHHPSPRNPSPQRSSPAICAACVHADLNFLASDELHGRGSGTRDEHLAALYAASLFQSFGLEPAGENGSYIQRAPLPAHFPEGFEKYMKSKGFDQNQRTDTWNALALLR